MREPKHFLLRDSPLIISRPAYRYRSPGRPILLGSLSLDYADTLDRIRVWKLISEFFNRGRCHGVLQHVAHQRRLTIKLLPNDCLRYAKRSSIGESEGLSTAQASIRWSRRPADHKRLSASVQYKKAGILRTQPMECFKAHVPVASYADQSS